MKQFLYLFLSIGILLLACNDPIVVGSELLDGETLDVEFTDVVDVTARTVEGEPSITFRNIPGGNYSAKTYMVGSTDDAVFGTLEAVTYFSPILFNVYPSFSEHVIDSVVLSIPLDSIGFYGDLSAIHNVELRAITESLKTRLDEEPVDTLLSDVAIEVEPTIWSTLNSPISYKDSVSFTTYSNASDSLINLVPQLRLELDSQFWIDLAGTAQDTLTPEELETQIPGFELRTTSTTSSIFGLDLSYTTSSRPANINIYYKEGDSLRKTYRIPLGRYKHSQFDYDYAGSDLQSSLDDPSSSELLYIQSQAGTSIEVDLSNAKGYDDKILNYAELVMTVQPEDEDLYQPISTLVPWYVNESGNLQLVNLLEASLSESYAGGSRTLSYAMNLTSHINRIKKGELTNGKIFLIPELKAQRPNRSIILGPDHSDRPMKLNMILTKP